MRAWRTAAMVAWICAGGVLQARAQAADAAAARPEFYTEQVKPILESNCFRCHGGMNHRGSLNMETRASLLKGGHSGPVIVAGDAAKSLLVRLIRHEGPADDPMPMPPPPRPKLSDADIAVVSRWINAGALMPEDVPKP